MSEQLPPSGPGGGRHDVGSTAQRRRKEAWRSMHRQNAPQVAAQTAHDARIAALIVRAVQHQVDQEGFQPSAARDARAAELTVRAIEAQVNLRIEQDFGARGGSVRGDQFRGRGRGQGRGDMQGGHHGRGGGGGGGRDATREGGRGGYNRRGSYGAAYRAGVVDAGRQNPPSDQVRIHQHSGHQVVRGVAPTGPRSWTRHQTRLEDMAGKSNLLL
ncbi:Craniofacial development protein 1/Bucentaur [Penicillium hordei]|uniref:Craniofacial development protein 1/Bucentaur n=1 Tax=Penicillium hordei TaxID=40994 RepID=A0AAD6H718_9EURO|nr:Craniofacial development protein 1/Bucentaur [Penicillium hordei]KAJ5614940.1 Craniofacial development protein 1/Bucentaur [Penicillium hordei]